MGEGKAFYIGRCLRAHKYKYMSFGMYKDGKDVELWRSGVLPPIRLENPLIGRHICSTNNCPFVSGYQTLRPMEMLVLEVVAER